MVHIITHRLLTWALGTLHRPRACCLAGAALRCSTEPSPDNNTCLSPALIDQHVHAEWDNTRLCRKPKAHKLLADRNALKALRPYTNELACHTLQQQRKGTALTYFARNSISMVMRTDTSVE